MSAYTLVLASASPRRKEILQTIGLEAVIAIADIDETPLDQENPKAYVARLAFEKVMKVAKDQEDSALIIGGDTIVILDGEILQKPMDEKEAKAMLVSLRGRKHEVLTGISIYDKKQDQTYTNVSETVVEMTAYTDSMIDAYIATGEPMDKAGSYGIQGIGAVLVKDIIGDYNTVVGLPVSEIIRGFNTLAIDYFDLLNK